jgi:protocatechuate 3,4-dioxygenase beta subunit
MRALQQWPYLLKRALKEGANMRCFYHVASGLCVLIGLVWGGISPAFGQEKTEEKTVGPFSGTVVDAAGKPVAGAAVWLSGGTWQETQAMDETISDAQGRFKLSARKWDKSEERAMPPQLTARDKQGRLGVHNPEYARSSADTTSNPYQNVKVKLHEVQDCPGRLLDESGQPIAKAKILPASWSWEQQVEGNSVQELIFFHAKLAGEMSAETDADGRFTLHKIPLKGILSAKIRAEGFGEPSGSWKTDISPTLTLKPVGEIHGKLVGAKEAKSAAGVRVQLQEKMDDSPRRESESRVSYFLEKTTREDGTFRFEQVPRGDYRVLPQLPKDTPYYVEKVESVAVKAGETATVSLTLLPAIKLQGKVIDSQTGKGIADAHVYLNFQDENSRWLGENSAISNAEGAFSLRTRPGKAFVNVYQFPDEYVNPSSSRQSQAIIIKEDLTIEPIRLERASVLAGIVVNKAGNPVADAEIRYTDQDFSTSLHNPSRSDAAGKFALKKISPKKAIILRVRTKNAAAEPLNVVPADLKEPLRVVVDEKTAFTLRGTVLDEAGKPIPEAEITLNTHWSWGSGGIGFQLHTSKTDEAGKFELGGLWSGDQYDIRVSSKDCEKFGSPQIKATPGKVHDFGNIKLLSANGIVEGHVLDAAGKPLPEIRVFNSGDGPVPVETKTDAAGKFRLQGLRKGPVFVFAEKEGFRFAGLRSAAGATDAVLKMLRTAEPAPAFTSRFSASVSEEEKKCARKLAELLLASSDSRLNQWAKKTIAQLDSERAAKAARSEAKTPPKKATLYQIAEEDVEEALSQLPKQNSQAYNALAKLAGQFSTSDPEKALRFVAEAVIRARNMDQPQRTVEMARMGALAVRLGDKEGGRKIVQEAAETASKWEVTDRNRWTILTIAQAVARCDVPLALTLLKKYPPNEQARFVADVAGALDDIEQAELLLKDYDQGHDSWYANQARVRVACRIAAKRPAEAVKIVEKLSSRGYGRDDEEKAKAYGWMASNIASTDQKLAHELVDRAMTLYLKSSDYGLNSYGGRPAQAAVLTVTAQKIGYPDMQSLIYRAMATRPTTQANENRWESPAVTYETHAMLAMFLALVDPDSAEQVLQSIEPQSELIGSGFRGIDRRVWLKAWALCNPRRAVELAEQAWTNAQKAAPKQRTESDIQEIVGLWLTVPDKRLKKLTERYPDMFLPSPSEDF